MEEEEGRANGFGPTPERLGSDWGHVTLLDKTKEFFRTCDVEGKGFISHTDMRRLHRELPLSAAELEDVFDSLDTDRAGYLTLEAFSSRFRQFLHGRRISITEDQNQTPEPVFKAKEALYQSQWEAKLSEVEDEEERHFSMLLDSLGGSDVFEDPGEVRSLWAQLRRDEPHLLSNFEEFLARVTHQIKEAHQEKKEMESALQRKAATHHSEIRHLYEEMEAQIKNEKDRLLLQDSERLQLRSQDLEHQLLSKESELEKLFQKQKRLELQCHELSSEKQESHVENVKLKMTNDELSRALESSSQELTLAQEQLAVLQEQAARLQEEKEMDMYRVTERLQREKQSLMKQLDLLREMNKHLKDERDICCSVPQSSLRQKQKQRASLADLSDPSHPAKSDDDTPTATPSKAASCQKRPSAKKSSNLTNGNVSPAQPKVPDVKAKTRRPSGKTGATKERTEKTETGGEVEVGVEEEVLDVPADGWPLRRVISIEEDHLPHLLQGGPQPLTRQLSEEEVLSDNESSLVKATGVAVTPPSRLATEATEAPSAKKSHFTRKKKTPVSSRARPFGKETQQKTKERELFVPDRLFKVVLVGNSSVGKTSLLRSFCEGRFHPSTTATVGIDYSVKTLTLDNMQVAMQLWDTAGQERYRSITKQFFRKADGVVVMYDVTVKGSFKAVRPWLLNVQEAAGEGIPILLLGNKMDMEGEREVSCKDAKQLAFENKVMFFEVSAFTGENVTEALTHLASVLKAQEDTVRDTTVILSARPIKKKACCK
ncbi:ras and EF-hand domain-containing protein isoform X2 [Kryptolebias marmoratus]|uniref:Calcium release activated channel regulator 2Ab n=1 Tax=Kryptolebias marmoratus TaxID=37003 RepID=A0A3Q3AXX2_KRYMA|nr:ras and EF-hand domain-containing protein isoform X2 [Kryptolebias marmoratus]